MNSIVEHRLKRGAEEVFCHSAKRVRLINHAYDDTQPTRGIKRRDREELEEPMEEPTKKSRVASCVKATKRKGDVIMNPTKRVKSMHRAWRRSVHGCRLIHDTGYDNDKDEDNHSVSVAIIA